MLHNERANRSSIFPFGELGRGVLTSILAHDSPTDHALVTDATPERLRLIAAVVQENVRRNTDSRILILATPEDEIRLRGVLRAQSIETISLDTYRLRELIDTNPDQPFRAGIVYITAPERLQIEAVHRELGRCQWDLLVVIETAPSQTQSEVPSPHRSGKISIFLTARTRLLARITSSDAQYVLQGSAIPHLHDLVGFAPQSSARLRTFPYQSTPADFKTKELLHQLFATASDEIALPPAVLLFGILRSAAGSSPEAALELIDALRKGLQNGMKFTASVASESNDHQSKWLRELAGTPEIKLGHGGDSPTIELLRAISDQLSRIDGDLKRLAIRELLEEHGSNASTCIASNHAPSLYSLSAYMDDRDEPHRLVLCEPGTSTTRLEVALAKTQSRGGFLLATAESLERVSLQGVRNLICMDETMAPGDYAKFVHAPTEGDDEHGGPQIWIPSGGVWK